METVGAETTCYRHPRRETYVRCSRCDRFICSDCMRAAPVGQRCPECVKGENRTIRQARTIFGAPAGVTTAYVTYSIIAINLLVYLVELLRPAIIERFDTLGTALVDSAGHYYIDDGAYPGYHQIGVLHGEVWRLLTGAFLHELPGGGFGLTHIAFNLMWIFTLGVFLERELGWARFLAVYLLAALGSSVLEVVLDPHQRSIGASGAGFGLAAAYFVVTRKLHHYPIDRNRLMLSFVLWLVLAAGFTSWQGHLGGLLTGAVVALGIAYAPKKHQTQAQLIVLAVVTLVLIAAIAAKATG
ncbi:rhomboid family intramembrane serine protease [Actinoplanes sp. KI2]|uniref:rhomboid family intramembrane serine protease n=1 Tax=Actinoplanes sp. KI2 TaxID=2983315 RepID=UPI0021D5CB88|nr:rhomboid family intramembrane serine protease [Actinoplanes sp. KI2]MCU7730269.1 rhomboid family intramembrane serine protease [Actinoplanes sp. KI2]